MRRPMLRRRCWLGVLWPPPPPAPCLASPTARVQAHRGPAWAAGQPTNPQPPVLSPAFRRPARDPFGQASFPDGSAPGGRWAAPRSAWSRGATMTSSFGGQSLPTRALTDPGLSDDGEPARPHGRRPAPRANQPVQAGLRRHRRPCGRPPAPSIPAGGGIGALDGAPRCQPAAAASRRQRRPPRPFAHPLLPPWPLQRSAWMTPSSPPTLMCSPRRCASTTSTWTSGWTSCKICWARRARRCRPPMKSTCTAACPRAPAAATRSSPPRSTTSS